MLFKLSESNIISRNCAACKSEMLEYSPLWVIPKKDEDGFDSEESEIFCSYECFSSILQIRLTIDEKICTECEMEFVTDYDDEIRCEDCYIDDDDD